MRKRFEFVQMLVNHFWKCFVREYFPTLIKRAKWRIKGRQLQAGDVVLLVDYSTARGKRDLGKIIEVFPGSDGIVRNVKVKTAKGEYKRSVQKCYPLVETDSSTKAWPGGFGINSPSFRSMNIA